MTSILDFAHAYAKRGWRVIPLHRVGPDGTTCSCRRGGNCTSKGKHPRLNEWEQQPAMSAADIQATWDVATPPNLGVAVGRPSGVWVLDIDPDHDGDATMRALIAEHGSLPKTFVAQTGSGGWHYYFDLPADEELSNTQARVGPGIDTRANGGQVVAPPSRTDKGDYVIIQDVDPAPAPEWLLAMVRKAEVDPDSIVTTADLPRREDIDPEQWARLNAYADKAVKGNLERLDAMRAAATPNPADYRGEAWNQTTFNVACSLIEIANSTWCSYGTSRARDDVMAHAPRDREFDDAVVQGIFTQALKRVGNGARAIPEDRRAEPDPLFDNPEVRSTRPTEAGEVGEALAGEAPHWSEFFDKKDFLAAKAADAVLEFGPLAWGRDEAFWSYRNGVWVSDPKAVRSRMRVLLGDRYRGAHAATVADFLETECIDRDLVIQGDPVPRWINFRNGLLDWQTGDMHAHTPEVLTTIQLPLDYDPEATCPTFDTFLAEVMHEDYVRLAWQMIGYLMYSGNRLQRAFLLYGSGGNGKGTLLRVIEDLLGRENIASESLDDLNSNRFSAVNLFGKIANLAGDIDGTYQESTANFKKLTGEDTYSGERKFGQRFTFESWAVPVFSANKIPGSADVTEGYLRRWVVLHFHKRITNVVPGLSNLLSQELPGIAAKGVRALRDLMDADDFAITGEARNGARELRLSIDQVAQWAASGDAIEAPRTWTPLHDLYRSYTEWAGRSGQGRLREQEFSHRLVSLGYGRDQDYGRINHQGLTVAPFGDRVASPATFFDRSE